MAKALLFKTLNFWKCPVFYGNLLKKNGGSKQNLHATDKSRMVPCAETKKYRNSIVIMKPGPDGNQGRFYALLKWKLQSLICAV